MDMYILEPQLDDVTNEGFLHASHCRRCVEQLYMPCLTANVNGWNMEGLLEVYLLRCWQPTLPEVCPEVSILHSAIDMCNLLSRPTLLQR